MAEKSIGQRRVEERYGGDPEDAPYGAPRARLRLDRMLTSDTKYMKEAVGDTAKILMRTAQEQTDLKRNRANQSNVEAAAKKAKTAKPSKYSKGGMVRRTGTALVHQGERVLTKKQNKKYQAKRIGK